MPLDIITAAPYRISPLIRFGESPLVATLSGPDGTDYSATYCHAVEKDKTVSEAYDLYYKGSLMDAYSNVWAYLMERGAADSTVAIAGGGEGGSLSYAALYRQMCDVGRGFGELGMSPFDRALIYIPSSKHYSRQWLLTCYGLWSHGMHLVVVTDADQLEIALRETKPRAVVTTREGWDQVSLQGLAFAPRCVLVDGTVGSDADITFEGLMAMGRKGNEEHQRTRFLPQPDHKALIVYSLHSPHNGIVLTHGNLHAAVTVTRPRLVTLVEDRSTGSNINNIYPTLRAVIEEPLSHIAPFILASTCLASAGCVSFSAADSLEKEEFAIVACTHANYRATKAVAERHGGGGAKGGLPKILCYCLPNDVVTPTSGREGQELPHSPLGNGAVGVAYWYSPIAASGVGLMRTDEGADVELMPGTELRLRRLDGGATGGDWLEGGGVMAEVMLRGPCVSKGYFTPNTEVEELDRTMLRGDGWLPTGDVVEVSQGGVMHIVGRLPATHDS